MEPLPILRVPLWPDPNVDGTYTVKRETATELFILVHTLRSYLDTQLTLCGLGASTQP